MLIVALVLAVIGLAALVTAVATSNELVAWVCIAASVIGVLLLIVDAIRERQRAGTGDEVDAGEADEAVDEPADSIDETYQNFDAEYPDADVEDADIASAAADAADAELDTSLGTSEGPADDNKPSST